MCGCENCPGRGCAPPTSPASATASCCHRRSYQLPGTSIWRSRVRAPASNWWSMASTSFATRSTADYERASTTPSRTGSPSSWASSAVAPRTSNSSTNAPTTLPTLPMIARPMRTPLGARSAASCRVMSRDRQRASAPPRCGRSLAANARSPMRCGSGNVRALPCRRAPRLLAWQTAPARTSTSSCAAVTRRPARWPSGASCARLPAMVRCPCPLGAVA